MEGIEGGRNGSRRPPREEQSVRTPARAPGWLVEASLALFQEPRLGGGGQQGTHTQECNPPAGLGLVAHPVQ